jgi:hypothetical protein
MLWCLVAKIKYSGLLPGDIIYKSNKVVGATEGYAHLPTIYELVKLVNLANVSSTFHSIPQIVRESAFDPFKYFRYSLWIFITKLGI